MASRGPVCTSVYSGEAFGLPGDTPPSDRFDSDRACQTQIQKYGGQAGASAGVSVYPHEVYVEENSSSKVVASFLSIYKKNRSFANWQIV